ncbi:hypothetical protein [Chitinimonas sp. BJYL2]|uniref:hypothetical protein n=1 Tax=Chitinimonas sp. BJYL2 TaxID=2976696 RepID=UPI0022B4177F|nr:hypothetical protein [Chitinimonas sp. BJYL2]
MKIAAHIKSSLDASDARELDKAMLFACLAVDGTAKRSYPDIPQTGRRFKQFITDNIDIIELMFGGINLRETNFPFKNSKGVVGVKFEDIIYEKIRCTLAHGDELPDGYEIVIKIAEGIHQFEIDIEHQYMTLPETVIYALGLACVLAPVNADQKIGIDSYHYRDSINIFPIDRWWGKQDCARQIMDFERAVKVHIDFSNVWPAP